MNMPDIGLGGLFRPGMLRSALRSVSVGDPSKAGGGNVFIKIVVAVEQAAKLPGR